MLHVPMKAREGCDRIGPKKRLSEQRVRLNRGRCIFKIKLRKETRRTGGKFSYWKCFGRQRWPNMRAFPKDTSSQVALHQERVYDLSLSLLLVLVNARSTLPFKKNLIEALHLCCQQQAPCCTSIRALAISSQASRSSQIGSRPLPPSNEFFSVSEGWEGLSRR